MYDNYARKAMGFLPEIRVEGVEYPPLIQVISETNNEVIYTVRMKDFNFQPKIFEQGLYTIIVHQPGTILKKEIIHLSSGQTGEPLIIDFNNNHRFSCYFNTLNAFFVKIT